MWITLLALLVILGAAVLPLKSEPQSRRRLGCIASRFLAFLGVWLGLTIVMIGGTGVGFYLLLLSRWTATYLETSSLIRSYVLLLYVTPVLAALVVVLAWVFIWLPWVSAKAMKVQKAITHAVTTAQEELRKKMEDQHLEDVENMSIKIDERFQVEVRESARKMAAVEIEAHTRSSTEAAERMTQQMTEDMRAERARFETELDRVRLEKQKLEEELQHVEEVATARREKAIGDTGRTNTPEPGRSNTSAQPTAVQRRSRLPPVRPDGLMQWETQANIILMARIKPVPGITVTTSHVSTAGQTAAAGNGTSEGWSELAVQRNELQQAVLGINISEKSAKPLICRSKLSTFNFTRVFGPESNNTHIFQALSPILPAYKQGYQIVLVADGLSGAGKTHTLLKSNGDRPLIPQTMEWIVQEAMNREDRFPVWIRITAVQYYQNKPSDLVAMLNERASAGKPTEAISAAAQRLLREKYEKLYDPSNKATLEIDLNQPLPSAIRICQNLDTVRQGRATEMNEASSRGHMVLTVQVQGHEGSFAFIDLCGSENADKSDQKTLEEWRPINTDREAVKEVLLAVGSAKKLTPKRVQTSFSKSVRRLLCDENGHPRDKLRFVMITHLIPGQATLNLRLLNDVPKLERSKIGAVVEGSEESHDTDPHT